MPRSPLRIVDFLPAPKQIDGPDRWELVGGQIITGVHRMYACQIDMKPWEFRPCPIHYPTDHHMRSWEQIYATAYHGISRACEHGVRHPDPDEPNRDLHLGHDCSCKCCDPNLYVELMEIEIVQEDI